MRHVHEQYRAILSRICRDVLDETHPGWQELVGLPEITGGTPPKTAYRKWLDLQPEPYRDSILNSFHPLEIGASIDRFQSWNGGIHHSQDGNQDDY